MTDAPGAKRILMLRARDGQTPEAFQAGLRERLAPALLAAGARKVRLNLPDAVAAQGAALRQSSGGPQGDALVQIWGEGEGLLAPLADHAPVWWGWAVEETVVLPNRAHPPRPGARTEGFAQIALLVRPPALPYDDWRAIWQEDHAQVAIETQSTFEYVQNRVLAPLSAATPPCDAIVEECFPQGALTDPLLFFGAAGDPARFKANLTRMMASCDRFIARGAIDVIPTGQYDFAAE